MMPGGCRKRKRGERVFKFKVFGERGYPTDFNGSFHDNLTTLLEYGQQVEVCGPMPSWSFHLEVRRQPLLHLFLVVVQEDVSLDLRCNHCHYIGWGDHMMCNKKYHFVLPAKSCGSAADYFKSSVVQLQAHTHTLHGVFHSNGFGHLLCINGSSETGSDLPGYQIMDFWDRLCSALGARKVSLKDEAKRKGMDLRLLHTVAYGKPWFGDWDYVFGRGTFGINQETYQSAVKAIQNIPVSPIATHQLIFSNTEVQTILYRYQILSGHSLVTLGDLFHFMLQLKFRIPKENINNAIFDSHYPRIMSDTSCRWSPKRVEMTIHVVVEALKRAEFQWVSRQHVRDVARTWSPKRVEMAIHVVVEALKRAEFQWVSRQNVRDVARTYIGDTGLLDFVLKSLGNHMVGKYFVRRCLNPVTKVLEYCLEDVSRAANIDFEGKQQIKVSWGQLTTDIFCAYKNILNARPNENTMMHGYVDGVLAKNASRVILDSKYLMKEYRGDLETYDETSMWRIYCAVNVFITSGNEKPKEKGVMTNNIISTPYHCFNLRSNTRFEELRCRVEKIFRETYVGLREFMAGNPIVNKRSDFVFKSVKPGSKMVFEWQLQQGLAGGGLSMVVDCLCGAKDDDGERMVTCDICQVWQHTRCVKIPENDEIPSIYICSACEQDIMHFPSFP
ncbi:PHD finger protein MALE STERILITY 1 [Striga hermonthica]|uniref:PHD finger protein MALE STERILITY 1 n=1 Tax=Striga hermonthica TaxID=68872 RepID=A0A9N7MS68_STRHE|nr:PHD finger protein MALE STERILITY 1 [Striga hermonthica]